MWCRLSCAILVTFHLTLAQVPQRLQIPGAAPVQGGRQAPLRQQRINALNTDFANLPRPRRPNPNASPFPVREIRPVIEEEQEEYSQQSTPSLTSFESEVNKLSIPALSSAVRQAAEEEEEEPTLRPSPLPFRPERPIPVTRDQIRERPQPVLDFPSPRPSDFQPPRPVLRQQQPQALSQPRQISRPARPVIRQEIDDEEENVPRQNVRQKVRPQSQVPAQQYRPRPQQDEDGGRVKKPVVQILRKYRTDNPDGSITWGYENDDGTFKEETLGINCVTTGKYGYFDPDGVKREFQYETGNRCDQRDEEELDEDEIAAKIPARKGIASAQKPQVQYRPQPTQYQQV